MLESIKNVFDYIKGIFEEADKRATEQMFLNGELGGE